MYCHRFVLSSSIFLISIGTGTVSGDDKSMESQVIPRIQVRYYANDRQIALYTCEGKGGELVEVALSGQRDQAEAKKTICFPGGIENMMQNLICGITLECNGSPSPNLVSQKIEVSILTEHDRILIVLTGKTLQNYIDRSAGLRWVFDSICRIQAKSRRIYIDTNADDVACLPRSTTAEKKKTTTTAPDCTLLTTQLLIRFREGNSLTAMYRCTASSEEEVLVEVISAEHTTLAKDRIWFPGGLKNMLRSLNDGLSQSIGTPNGNSRTESMANSLEVLMSLGEVDCQLTLTSSDLNRLIQHASGLRFVLRFISRVAPLEYQIFKG